MKLRNTNALTNLSIKQGLICCLAWGLAACATKDIDNQQNEITNNLREHELENALVHTEMQDLETGQELDSTEDDADLSKKLVEQTMQTPTVMVDSELKVTEQRLEGVLVTSTPERVVLQTKSSEQDEISSNAVDDDSDSTTVGGSEASNIDMEMFVTAPHVDITNIASISRFRSAAGHDFTDSVSQCSSMKHYFRNVDYYGTRFSQEIYSPVDGIIHYITEGSGGGQDDWLLDYRRMTGLEPPEDYRDMNIFIRPDRSPSVWIRHFHLNPLINILKAVGTSDGRLMMMGLASEAEPGFRVKARELIGFGLPEISVTQHTDGLGIPSMCNSEADRRGIARMTVGCQITRFHHSIFDLMTDEVLVFIV